MGIKGLKRFLREVISFKEELILNNSTLHVDGYGLLFYCLESTQNEFHRELMGCYDCLYDIVMTELQNLKSLNIIIYFDGKSQMKERTSLKRLNDSELDWDNLSSYCEQNDFVVSSSKSLPLPALTISQFKSIIAKVDGIKIVNCEFEADRAIAEACCNGNKLLEVGEELHYCYGSDSDFYLYEKCPYIEIGTLRQSGSDTFLADHVWRLSDTVSQLQLTKSKFIEFCLLLGNDYTGGNKRDMKLGDIDISESISDVSKLYAIIFESEDDVILTSEITELNEALVFSRKLYCYEDISTYPIDNDISHLRPYALPLDHRTIVRNTLSSDVQSIVTSLSLLISQSIDSGEYNFISTAMLEGLSIMLAHLQGIKSFPIDMYGNIKNSKLTFDEVKAAHYFQQISSEYLKLYNNKNLIEALHLYNGKTFLKCLQYIKTTKTKQLKIVKNGESKNGREISNGVSKRNILKNTTTLHDKLPIDNYRDEILQKVKNDRVIIIHGETGCGKSSRLPVILLEDAMNRNKDCKMMVSQPRRIAASSLMKRVKQSIGEKVGLRMGFGVKDENDDSVIIFVTTGYLVRLLAFRPQVFKNHTYLIIDEVHERSVDCDVLCFLARKLLNENNRIKIILMSATIHVDLYSTYFSPLNVGEYVGDLECLSVGVRRFPVDITYTDDMLSDRRFKSCQSNIRKINELLSIPNDKINPKLSKFQYEVVESIIRNVVPLGTAVLVFLSGISDITELAEKFENISTYRVIIIHSDIPLEEQELAFSETDPSEVKVILATNAAESSITLPDVDTVICLGSHKAIKYSISSHRSELGNCWISKASATQRSGRTGRVRPGKCFRLYSKKTFESFDEHEASEVTRLPAQELILNLRVMFQEAPSFEGVIPILLNLIESPDMVNINKSFLFLFENGMITSPDDEGDLTSLGRFAGQLPVDINMSKLIANGITLGVCVESAIIAAALTQPRTLFRSPTPLIITDPDEYADVIKQVYLGSLKLDDYLYSEPLMYARAYLLYLQVPIYKRDEWISTYGLVHQKFKSFVQTASSLVHKVRDVYLSISSNAISRVTKVKDDSQVDYKGLLDEATKNFTSNKLNILRLLLLWSSGGNILIHNVPKAKDVKNVAFSAHDNKINDNQLNKLFCPLQHNHFNIAWNLELIHRKIYDGCLSKLRLSQFGLIDLFIEDIVYCACHENEILAPLVWIHDKIGLPCDVNGAVYTVLSKLDKLGGDDRLFFVVSSNEVYELLSIVIAKEKLLNIGDGIFVCIKPSKKELTDLHLLIEKISRGLYMVLPKEGNAKVNTLNVHIDKVKLEKLFFSNENLLVDKSKLSKIVLKKFVISEQVLETRKVLSFNNLTNPSTSKLSNLIDDLPLGYRLINAIRTGYKSKKLYLKDIVSNGSSAPIGSAAWASNRKSENPSDSLDKVEIEVNSYIPKWSYHDLNLRVNKTKNCILQRQSVCGQSIDINKPIYAPFYGLLELVDSNAIVCEKVSFLPTSYRWLYLAFQCSKWYNFADQIERTDDRVVVNGNDLEKCELVRQLLSDCNNNSINEDFSLISLINELFSNYESIEYNTIVHENYHVVFTDSIVDNKIEDDNGNNRSKKSKGGKKKTKKTNK